MHSSAEHEKSFITLGPGFTGAKYLIGTCSRTSMARTSLGLWKLVRDMGISSYYRLFMVSGQVANGDNLGKSVRQ